MHHPFVISSYVPHLILVQWTKERRDLQISAETAQKLAESLNLPLEQIMHMPQHILLAKMAELQKEDKS